MASSYIPGAPSYVRQGDDGKITTVNTTPSPWSYVGGGAPSYLERNTVTGEVRVKDTSAPASAQNTSTNTGQATAKKVAETVKNDDTKKEVEPTATGKDKLTSPTTKAQDEQIKKDNEDKKSGNTGGGGSSTPYAPTGKKANWAKGKTSKVISNTGSSTKASWPTTQKISSSMFSADADRQTPTYQAVKLNESKYATTPANTKRYTVYQAKYKTSWQEPGRKKEMLNKAADQIQNDYQYPKKSGTRDGGIQAYDYRFIPGSGPSKNIESMLEKVRMQYGIQVHGNPNLERNVLYYMYNRFKSPDWGLAHSKAFTHVFFTRPDLYLMESATQPAEQLSKHSEMSMIYRTHPDLVRLLCDGKKMGDVNNFNFLLSNRCASFPMQSEGLNKIEVGKSWNDHKIVYGDGYTGRFAGEFSCTFNETADYSIINLIKLWITYIDNVSRGAMKPYYGHHEGDYGLEIPDDFCHVHHKALDYAASAYVFKVDPRGEEVLYWTKYYGVFPISTGASALSWELGQEQGTPKLDITFAYSYKADLTPIALEEFNYNAGEISGQWVPSYDIDMPGSARPLVGCPYIELVDKEPEIKAGTNHVYNTSQQEIESIKLRFQKDNSGVRTDRSLFRATL